MRAAFHLFILAWLLCLNATAQEMAAQPFLGEWSNRNGNTDSITRAEIKLEKSGIAVQMWGKCHPRDCDWGIATAKVDDPTVDGPALQVIWEKSFCAMVQTLSLNNDDILTVETRTHFTDKSGRKDYVTTDFFIRKRPAAKKAAAKP